mgnify:CR=1 FL=1|jgi:hypothetical protein|tara:strand:+ start:730 stop:906 length:177 start_codon:yes stop_codon:yes gene_type:complete
MGTSITSVTKEKKAEKTLVAVLEILKATTTLDVLERIQQQLAKMNEDENLGPGDRHYG